MAKIIKPGDLIEPLKEDDVSFRDKSDLELQMKGWRLSTLGVLYYMPDHPKLIQEFTWQTLDLAPKYPRITQFLDFWKKNIEAVIHSVSVAAGDEIAPARTRFAAAEFRLN